MLRIAVGRAGYGALKLGENKESASPASSSQERDFADMDGLRRPCEGRPEER